MNIFESLGKLTAAVLVLWLWFKSVDRAYSNGYDYGKEVGEAEHNERGEVVTNG